MTKQELKDAETLAAFQTGDTARIMKRLIDEVRVLQKVLEDERRAARREAALSATFASQRERGLDDGEM